MKSGYIIDFFKCLVDEGIFDSTDEVQLACARYCFGPLIQSELDAAKANWNSHYIRKSGYSEVHGRPDYNYTFPKNGYLNFGYPVQSSHLNILKYHLFEYGTSDPSISMYTDYFDYAYTELNLLESICFVTAADNFVRLMDVV